MFRHLAMRRKMHTAGALFSGRQPISNAMVPGGVTTMLTQSSWPLTPQTGTDYDLFGPYNFSDIKVKFTTLLGTVRQFINETYIPDVVYVATSYGTEYCTLPLTQGSGCQEIPCIWRLPATSTRQREHWPSREVSLMLPWHS